LILAYLLVCAARAFMLIAMSARIDKIAAYNFEGVGAYSPVGSTKKS